MTDKAIEADCDRLLALIRVATEAVKADDEDGAILALTEAIKVAEAMPQKPPEASHEEPLPIRRNTPGHE